MSITTVAVGCAALLVLSVLLFLVTSAKRDRLDAALRRAAPARTLDPPERLPTYDQDYMIAFIAAARDAVVNGRNGLAFYAGPILSWDIGFALAFAAFVVAADMTMAEWLAACPWAARACLILACMGLLYGAADVAEDVMLRKIFRNAESIEARRQAGAIPHAATAEQVAEKTVALREAELADAAQTDAANALTRLKMVTLFLSVIGIAVFYVILKPAAWVMKNWIMKKASADGETARA